MTIDDTKMEREFPLKLPNEDEGNIESKALVTLEIIT
jgi:hypothetical protein